MATDSKERLATDVEEPAASNAEERSATDAEERLATDVEEPAATDAEDDLDSYSVEERNKRFLQAVSFFIEWAKHIITLGSALMVLSIVLLKDIVRDARAPFSYVIAGLLVLFYLSMLGAIWLALRFVRFAASCVLTTASQIVTSNKLTGLRARLDRVQIVFLISLTFFSGLALCALLAWAFGWAPAVSR